MKNLLLDYGTNLVRIALLDNFELKDLILESKENRSAVFNIYVARIKNILPNQFVFLDIGQDKNAFLQLDDAKESGLFANGKLQIKQNDQLLVQVIKDATGSKGACATSQVSMPGKYLVLLTNAPNKEIGVSKKITDLDERKRLKDFAMSILEDNYGLIIRTSAENIKEDELLEEFNYLFEKVNNIINRSKYLKAPYAIYKEEYPGEKAIIDLYSSDVSNIYLEGIDNYESVCKILDKISVDAKDKLTIYNESRTLFDNFNIENTINKLLARKVWLKSGGFLLIEQTEACVVIDVNTGKNNKSGSVLKTNLEACSVICKEIRLRNLSGMIIIDFIDMKNSEHKEMLVQTFTEYLQKDKLSTTIVGMTKLGLMQLTRKKYREPIANILLKPCNNCNGLGKEKSDEFIIHELIKDLNKKNVCDKTIIIDKRLFFKNKVLLDDISKDYNIEFILKENFEIGYKI